jgi:C-terminal processing protease CtpA/Prc
VTGDPRATQLTRIIELVRERYVFPEVAEQVAELLGARAYGSGLGDEAFAAAVTADLQSVNGDKHLRLQYALDVLPDSEDVSDAERYRAEVEHNAYGIVRVERLAGNVGVLEVRQLYGPEEAGAAVAAAFTLLAHTDALILDLRRCPGGDPSQVALICTYLFDEMTHLNTIHSRVDGSEWPFWTLPYVPGTRFGGTRPVWVLTSAATFSGGEELAYNLQSRKRATLVGETTRGGAHPTDRHRIADHLRVTVPFARSVNPVTGTNWEGTGVVPEIATPAAAAFPRAYRLALERALGLGDAAHRRTTAAEATEALARLG